MAAICSAINRSPGPIGSLAGKHITTTSTSDQVSATKALSRSPSNVFGLWTPGVSIRTSWPSGRVTIPRIVWRVVCGRSEVIATFWPTSALVNVDFPTLGRPTMQANPLRIRANPFLELV